MKIEHIAIWTKNLDEMKDFYEKFFHGQSNKKYVNPTKHFESYFLTFEDGARLELMMNSSLNENSMDTNQIYVGYAHLAFSMNSREEVDELTNEIKKNGYEIKSGPRITGDGYYESCFLDPDGNMVELTT